MRYDSSRISQHHRRDLAEADSKGAEEVASLVPREASLLVVDSLVVDHIHSLGLYRLLRRSVV
jgi:hypothetical protein